jgi:hypothetical protein
VLDTVSFTLGLVQNILGGFLAAVAFLAVIGGCRWLRPPLYLPFESNNWSDATKSLLAAAGYDPAQGDAGWAIN